MDNATAQHAYLYGINATMEALAAHAPLEKIYIAYGSSPPQNLLRRARQLGVPIVELDRRRFAELARQIGATKHQGVIALRQMYRATSLEEFLQAHPPDTTSLLVACDGITDPRNFGAIVRTAAAAGAAGIIAPVDHTAAVTPAALSAASGAFEHVHLIRTGSLVTALMVAKEHGYWIIGTAGDGEHLYTEPLYDRPLVLVIGSEGSGMRRSVRKVCDAVVRIPLAPPIESLNASVAAGVVLFEIVRQRTIAAAAQRA